MPEIATEALSNRQNKARQSTLVTAAPYYTGVMAILEAIKQIKRRLNQANQTPIKSSDNSQKYPKGCDLLW